MTVFGNFVDRKWCCHRTQKLVQLFKDLFNARYILSSSRLAWIDYARGICIILVCYRHCFDGLRESHLDVAHYHLLEILNVCFYSFRMPLFFIISGLFVSRSLQKKRLADYIRSRFYVVFYPLLLWGSLQITLQLIFRDYVNGKPALFDYVNLIIFPRNPSNNQQFWYLNALFFVGAIYAFFKIKLRFSVWVQLGISVVLYAIAAWMDYSRITFYIFPDIFHYYIYFCIGDLVAPFIFKREATEKMLSPTWLLLSFISCLPLQAVFTMVNMSHGNDDYVNVNLPFVLLPISLSGCALMVQFSQIMQRKNTFRWLRVVGYHSLYIYLMHLMIISGVRIMLTRLLHITNVPLIMGVAISMGVVIPVLMYNFCIRLGGWWLFSLKKPVAEINYYATMKAALKNNAA